MAKHAKPVHLEMYEKFTNPEGNTLKVRIKANKFGEHMHIVQTEEGNLIDMALRDETYLHSLIESEWYFPVS